MKFHRGIYFVLLLSFLAVFLFVSGCIEPKYDCSVKQGSVTVTNGLNTDALVNLVDKNNNVIQSVMINANSKGKINNICNGRFYLFYELGEQWDPAVNDFRIIIKRSKFVDPLDFDGSNYYEATLQPVVGGNAQTSTVDESNWPK